MSMWLAIGWIMVFIAASGLFSGLETGGYSLNRVRLRATRSKAARRLERTLSSMHLFIFTVLISNNITIYLASKTATDFYTVRGVGVPGQLLGGVIPWNAETAATLTLMLPLFLFAEVIPKTLFRHHADRWMYESSRLLRAATILFWPVTRLLELMFVWLSGRGASRSFLESVPLSLEGFRGYVSEGTQSGALNAHQNRMIERVLAMPRVPVQRVMLPLNKVVSVSERVSVAEACERMRSAGCGMLAVYSGGMRRITGFVDLFDLMSSSVDTSVSIENYVRPALKMQAMSSLKKAFGRLRREKQMCAIVVNAAGHSVGLLHLRDLAGYIVRTI